MANTDLKRGPFCGQSDYAVHLQKLFYENENYTKWEIMCECCGAEAGACDTPERAAAAWNRRSDNE